jgi:hypothetical protein
MLKKPCPYHKTPVNHTLEQCDMLKKYYIRAAVKDGEAKKDGGDGDTDGFPAVENVFLIFGGATIDMSNSQRKRELHEILTVEKAPPSFLDWSEDAITFSREDHLNRIPNPGQYPLVVDPIISNARFSKVLMDGGSNLNILYAHTLQLMGIGLDQLRPSTMRPSTSSRHPRVGLKTDGKSLSRFRSCTSTSGAGARAGRPGVETDEK